jgi:hypothetical protein
MGAARCAIAAAAHLARDDRGPEGVLGAPVGGVERGVEEEAEDGLVFGGQMRREAARVGEAARSAIEQAAKSIHVGAAGDGKAMCGDATGGMARARREGGLQQRLHLRGKRMVGMVQHHRATAAQQMCEARLMCGVDKLPVRRPAVALQDARVVGPEHPRRLGKPAAVFDRVGGGVRRGKGPEPVRVAADLPASLIGRDDRTAADLGAERRIGRLGVARGAMDGVHQPAPRHGESETIAEQGHDAAEGEAALFTQDHGQRDGLRAELHGRSAQCVRGLQRMPSCTRR